MPYESQHSFGTPSFKIESDVEKQLLSLVVDGFEQWKNSGYESYNPHEDNSTIQIVRYMRKVRRLLGLQVRPEIQYEVPSDRMWQGEEHSSHAGTIDIAVVYDLCCDEAYLSIECKRLETSRHYNDYVNEGILRFIRGNYASKVQTGAMLGYVRQKQPSEVINSINSQIENVIDPSHILSPTTPIKWLDSVYTSEHTRTPPLPHFRLTHLLFPMPNI